MEIANNQPLERFSEALLSAVDTVFPDANPYDDFKRKVLSGEPNDALHKCSYGGEPKVAKILTKELGIEIKQATSFGVMGKNGIDTSAHNYLVSLDKKRNPDDDLVIDAAAGQYIPKSSRIGFEQFFKGNIWIGPRKMLRSVCLNGVVNTSTKDNPNLSFQRVWGDSSYVPEQ